MTTFKIQFKDTGEVLDTFSNIEDAEYFLYQLEIVEYCSEELKGIEDLENERQDV